MACLASGGGRCWASPSCAVADLYACPGVSESWGLWNERVKVEPGTLLCCGPKSWKQAVPKPQALGHAGLQELLKA